LQAVKLWLTGTVFCRHMVSFARFFERKADMTDPKQKEREAETAKVRAKEGSGTVPNVTDDHAGQVKDETEQLKEAVHELEEEKGDWSKGRG